MRREKITIRAPVFLFTQMVFLLTNEHIVEGSKEIAVVTSDGRTLPAQVIRADAYKDLALIKVAGRVTEMVTRTKVALPSCYPHKDSLMLLFARAAKLPP